MACTSRRNTLLSEAAFTRVRAITVIQGCGDCRNGMMATGSGSDRWPFWSTFGITPTTVIQSPGTHERLADAIRRGKAVALHHGADLFDVDYYALAARPVGEVRELLGVPPKSPRALACGSVGPFVLDGMSETQQRANASRRGGAS